MATETIENTATDTTAPTSPGQEDFAAQIKSTLMSELGASADSASAEPAQEPSSGTEPDPTPAATHPIEPPASDLEPGSNERGLPQGVINQLAELRKERRELREKVRTLEDQPPPQDAEPPPAGEAPVADPAPPLQVETLEAIEQERRQLEDFEDLAEQNLTLINHRPDAVERALRREGVELKDEDGHDDFTEDRMLDFLLNVRQNSRHRLKRELPQREQALKRSQEQRGELEGQHPWLKDTGSKEYQLANKLLQERGHLFKGPNWLADLVEGVQFTLWKQGQTSPAPAPAKAAIVPEPAKLASRTGGLQPAGDPLPGGTAPAPRTATPEAATADLSKRIREGDGAAAHDLLRRALGNVRHG